MSVYAVLLVYEVRRLRSRPPKAFQPQREDPRWVESVARVERAAGELGLWVTRYAPALSGGGAGAIGGSLAPNAQVSIEFKGEVRVLGRVTLTGLAPDLELATEGAEPKDRTGDPEFDRRFSLGSRLWASRGALGPEARAKLLALLETGPWSLRLSGGALTLRPPREGSEAQAQRLSALVPLLRALHGLLQPQPAGERWVMGLARSDPSPGARARAIDLLTEAPLAGEVRGLVEAALVDPSPEVKLAAALALANISILNDMGPEVLVRALSRDAGRVLKGLEAARAEDALALLLAQEDEDVQVGAAEALGRIGTVGAVEPLRALTERGLLDSASKRAARQAILNIQSRLQGAEAGQIAVIGEAPQAGAVAVAEGGHLAIGEEGA